MTPPGRRFFVPLLFLAFPVLLRLAFPPFSLLFLAPLAFAAVFQGLALARRPVLWAFLSHVLFVVLLCDWLFLAMTGHYHLSIPVAGALFLGLACVPASLFFVGFSWAMSRLVRAAGTGILPGLTFALVAASAFTVTEFLRTQICLEKGWAHLATVFFGHPAFLGWASLVGRAGLSFMVVLWGVLAWLSARAAFERRVRPALVFFLCLAVAAGAMGGLGAWRHRPGTGKGLLLETALVHPAIRQEDRWKSSFQEENLVRYQEISHAAFPGKRDPSRVRLLVWPETAITRALVSFPEAGQAVADLARQKDAFVILGSPHFTGDGPGRRFFNSVFLAGAGLIDRYDKIILLPLAEAATGPLSIQTEDYHGNYHAGGDRRILVMPTEKGPIGLGVAVCFEVASAAHMTKSVREGARVFLNLSNDAWFGQGAESVQQLSLLALACAEHRVPGIRSTGYGVSALVDERGRVTGETGILSPPLLSGTVRVPPRRPTPETRFPAWFILQAGAILVLWGLARVQAMIDNKPPFT